MPDNKIIKVGETVEFNYKSYFIKSLDKVDKGFKRYIISDNSTEFYLFYTTEDFNLIFGEYIYLVKQGIELPQIYFMDESSNYIITEIKDWTEKQVGSVSKFSLEMWFK